MFNKEKPTTEKFLSNSATLISAGTKLKGDVRSENDLRIDGTIKGNVSSSAKIIVGPTGFVEGNIDGAQADITGKVQGHIMAKEMVQLRDQSNVQGNITTVSLQIDIGAVFNGQSIMGVAADNVVQMTEDEGIHAKAN